MIENTEAACTLTPNGDSVWVPHEVSDILLDPHHRLSLIQQSLVSRSIFKTKGQESKRPKSVVNSNNDHIMRHPKVHTIPVSRTFKDKVKTSES